MMILYRRLGLLLISFRLLLLCLLVPTITRGSSSSSSSSFETQQQQQQPNFVIILTDDLDLTLGGLNASTLHRSRKLIGNQGLYLSNWFAQTPVCCPSRAELLTGKMYHNLKLPSALIHKKRGVGCMHVNVEPRVNHSFYKHDYFAQYFQQLNYTVGIFGKHLNIQNPKDFLPPGVDIMLINGGGSYEDPTFTFGTKGDSDDGEEEPPTREIHFNNCTESTGMSCYSTSIIGNTSLDWITRHVQQESQQQQESQSRSGKMMKIMKPFFSLISVKAPHILDGPVDSFPMSIPAPWYQNNNDTKIPEQQAPRLPNYNLSAIDHHWLVRTQTSLTQLQATKVDELYVSRLKTLISVDDLVEELVLRLKQLNVLSNTYIIFTSDNGYRLGQYRIPQCKLHAYENDIRVPMMIRGPNLKGPKGSTLKLLSTHVNLMPTLLGLASSSSNNNNQLQQQPPPIPKTMDGINLASYIVNDHQPHRHHHQQQQHHGSSSSSSSSSSSASITTTTDNNNNSTPPPPPPPLPPPPTSILIEYTSLGEVRRYQHLIDTYNHTFLALRILQEVENLGSSSDNNNNNNNNSNNNGAATIGGGGVGVISNTNTIINWKYIEYRDSRIDWNCTKPPIEREFFDLNNDPYEIHNIVNQISPILLKQLESKIQRLFHCFGETCRKEQQQQQWQLQPSWKPDWQQEEQEIQQS